MAPEGHPAALRDPHRADAHPWVTTVWDASDGARPDAAAGADRLVLADADAEK